ncbi:MAG TPA: cupin domain-containing protein [Bryobacteraceae bacterium]|jgi:quercetin dioxygenase-like cupin family protein|nr:cupin domain-containing protein [Bryobacteraceae bacterium]
MSRYNQTVERYNWTAVLEEKLNPLLSRRCIHTPRMTVARLWLGKGAVVPLHEHVNQQVTMIETGALEFEMEGKRIVLKPGDALVIPPHVPHSVEALEESTATDLFTPAREDWIRGDDAYLRG